MSTYDYRRELTRDELLPAIGAGVAAGLVAGYIAQIYLRRTPLRPGGKAPIVHDAPTPEAAVPAAATVRR